MIFLKRQKKEKKRRVVVTGLGVVSSIGIGVDDFWKNLIAGKSGISEVEAFDTSAYPVHKGGEVKIFKPEHFIDKRKIKYLGRASQMAIAAAKLAVEDGWLDHRTYNEVGVFMGTTMGEIQELERTNSDLIKDVNFVDLDKGPLMLYPMNRIATNVATELGLSSYNYMLPSACSAGNYSIGHAFDLIRTGQIDVALAGGSDSFSRIAFSGFNRLMAMAPEKCQPFDKNRKGMILGEGAGVLLLESLEHVEKRKVKIYGEILGYGLSCDAHHMTQPLEEGIVKCMEKALKNSNLKKEDIDYICTHGTGTIQNDQTESCAINKVFKQRAKSIFCNSIKSMLGHALGAASAIEALSCCLTLKNSIIPPTINFEAQDENCNINCVPNRAKKINVRVAFNNSYAFGGNNVCVAFKDYGCKAK